MSALNKIKAKLADHAKKERTTASAPRIRIGSWQAPIPRNSMAFKQPKWPH